MKIEEIEKQVAFGKKLTIAGFAFQVTHTIFFLIRDGWHWKAASFEEQICDLIAVLVMLIGIAIFLFAFARAVIVALKLIAEIASHPKPPATAEKSPTAQ